VIIDSTVVSASKMPEQEIASWVAFANKRRVPLVMLTPRAFEFDTAQYIKSGVDICVAKPFQATDLAQTLNRLKVAAP
jgi:CheY-like chemotaxis protein